MYSSQMREVVFDPNPRPGSNLVEWLNSGRNTRPAQRIADLIHKIGRLQLLETAHKKTLLFDVGIGLVSSKRRLKRRDTLWETYDHHWSDDDLRRFESQDPVFVEVCRLNSQIAQELNKFSFTPRVAVTEFGTRVRWLPSPKDAKVEHKMLSSLLGLAERGQLDLIAQCERCGRWFCSLRPGAQKFCSAKCQQAHYKSSPDWRAHRARYMRSYRKIAGKGGK